MPYRFGNSTTSAPHIVSLKTEVYNNKKPSFTSQVSKVTQRSLKDHFKAIYLPKSIVSGSFSGASFREIERKEQREKEVVGGGHGLSCYKVSSSN